MRRAAWVVLLMVGYAAAVSALDWYPRTSIAEDGTATWCGYCPYAYEGLEVVHSQYDYSEFVSVRYYAASGDYGSPEVTAALAFYGISSFPTVIFNGTERVVGGSPGIAAGGPYLGVVGGAYYTPSPVKIVIDSFDTITGDISATVTMYAPADSLTDDYIRFVLIEDNVAGNHTHVTRDIVNDTISLTGQGSSTTFNKTFDIDPSWDPAELHAVVFVQTAGRRVDKEVVQVACSYPQPVYKARAVVTGSMMQIGPPTGVFDGEDFSVVNVGLPEDFTINIIVDSAPPGWTATYCDESGHCFTGESSFSLGNEQAAIYHANIMPASLGAMEYHFEVSSPNLGSPLVIPFTYFTTGLDALVVDDDGSDYEHYFSDALDTLGLSYGVWDLTKTKLTDEAAQTFPALIWTVGETYPTLDPVDRDYLRRHLDNGNSLFLTGQDIGWDLNDPGAGNLDPAFYHDYLHATYIRDDVNIYDLDGVPGDPVSDGLSLHIQGGDGASNQDYPSEIAARDGDATEILHYTGGYCGGIRSVDSGSAARVVYLAFGYEAIDNPADRASLMGAAMDWLLVTLFSDGLESGDTSAWSRASP